jgi:transposase
LAVQQIGLWKREFLGKADLVFEKRERSKKSESEEKQDQLLRMIGEQKVEIDFLKNALR